MLALPDDMSKSRCWKAWKAWEAVRLPAMGNILLGSVVSSACEVPLSSCGEATDCERPLSIQAGHASARVQ